MKRRWRLRQGLEYRLRYWEGEETAVLFDTGSGDTHLLGSPAIACLERLASAPEGLEVDDIHTLALLQRLEFHHLVESVS